MNERYKSVPIRQHRYTLENEKYLTGKILIAMPFLPDPRFSHAVIYVCGHDAQGAMGLIINRSLPSVTFEDLLEQMDVGFSGKAVDMPIYYGGPVEMGRGFVLHTNDFVSESTVLIEQDFAMTATIDILRAISTNQGPKQALLALGYVGWGAGQLESEIQDSGWLMIEADLDLVFGHSTENKWRYALSTLGIDPAGLSFEVGHA